MQNSRPDYLSILARRVASVTALIVCVYFLVPMSGRHLTDQHLTPASSTSDLYSTAATVGAPAVDDVAAEGQDVLMVGSETAPGDLWQGLLGAGYRDTDRTGVLNVPIGTAVNVPGGLYLATLDGWAGCRDGWWAQECSATGPVVLLDIPVVPSAQTDQCTDAAAQLLDALNTWTWIEEDLSYRGMNDVAAQCNDQLATAYYATPGHRFDFNKIGGGSDLRAFLAQRTHDAAGCFYDPDAPAWESETTVDGLCRSGPHAVDVPLAPMI